MISTGRGLVNSGGRSSKFVKLSNGAVGDVEVGLCKGRVARGRSIERSAYRQLVNVNYALRVSVVDLGDIHDAPVSRPASVEVPKA